MVNGTTWQCGTLDIMSLADLRTASADVRTSSADVSHGPGQIREMVANIRTVHRDPSAAGALFQVASQFNLLEMAAPDVTPERGVGIYERDLTQGPACAVAAGAGTIYRNYFVPVNGRTGQTADNQIDCLADVGRMLGNAEGRLWRMVNGYMLPTAAGLEEISTVLAGWDERRVDQLRGSLRVGLHRGVSVTLPGCHHTVHQIYCSALPVAYADPPASLWEPLARRILEAACEATLSAAMQTAAVSGNRRLYLTLLGGGAFGNPLAWILDAIRFALSRHPDHGLDIAIVSFGRSQPHVQALVDELS